MTFPVFVRLAQARVVSVGGGPVAAAKVLPLLDEGAQVVVVSPEVVDEIAAAAREGRLTWQARGWREADLEGAVMVVAATADPQVNGAVAAAAAASATLCVRVDREGDGSADFGAVVRRGALTIAVSTSGQAPALAGRVREDLEMSYGPEWGEAVALYAALREDPRITAALSGLSDGERRRRWRALPLPDILRMLRTGRLHDAKEAAFSCLSSSSG